MSGDVGRRQYGDAQNQEQRQGCHRLLQGLQSDCNTVFNHSARRRVDLQRATALYCTNGKSLLYYSPKLNGATQTCETYTLIMLAASQHRACVQCYSMCVTCTVFSGVSCVLTGQDMPTHHNQETASE